MTARRCREDMIERSDSAERMEPKLAKEPMEKAEAKDPMEPMDRTEPTLPIDKTEFLDPIDRIEPCDQIEQQERCLVTARVYGSSATTTIALIADRLWSTSQSSSPVRLAAPQATGTLRSRLGP